MRSRAVAPEEQIANSATLSHDPDRLPPTLHLLTINALTLRTAC